MPEKSPNLLLRRADWRFLLSNPNPEKSICFAGDSLKAAVSQISDNVIDPASDDKDCELAVAQNPNQETLRTAWSALKPGGALYIEWNLNLHTNPDNIRLKLEALGFEDITLYFPKINPVTGGVDVWIPVDDKRPITFFISESLKNVPKSMFRRSYIILRSYLWRFGSNLVIRFPWLLSPGPKKYAISSIATKVSTNPSHKSGSPNSPETKNYTGNTIQAKLSNIGLTRNIKNLSILMFSDGISIYKKAILMVFDSNQKEPDFIIKMPRIQKSASYLSIEAETLLTLQEKHSNLKGIPKVLYYDKRSNSSMVAETFINGTLINKILNKDNYNNLAFKGTDVLVDLANSTKMKAPGDWWNKLVEPILSEFVSAYGSVLHPSIMQEIIDIMQSIELKHTVCHHTDFSPWNLLLTPTGELGVLDWESSQIRGLPLLDFVYFQTYLCVYLEDSHEPQNFLECYRRMLDGSTYTGEVYKECLHYYCDKVDIPISAVVDFRLLTWLHVLNWKYYELIEDTEEHPPPQTLGNIPHLSLLDEELSQRKVRNEQ